MNTVRIRPLADPNVTKSFQIRAPTFSVILSSDLSYKRFMMDIYFLLVCVVPWLLLLCYSI
jgi:hypothetical protein